VQILSLNYVITALTALTANRGGFKPAVVIM